MLLPFWTFGLLVRFRGGGIKARFRKFHFFKAFSPSEVGFLKAISLENDLNVPRFAPSKPQNLMKYLRTSEENVRFGNRRPQGLQKQLFPLPCRAALTMTRTGRLADRPSHKASAKSMSRGTRGTSLRQLSAYPKSDPPLIRPP